MTPAQEMLADLRARGVALRVVGDGLRFRPLAAVTPELRARMAACKPELVALMRPASPPEPTAAEVEAEEAPIPEFGDGDRPTVKRCPICREGDFTRPPPRGRWCFARCHPYEGMPASGLEWYPAVQSVVSLDVLLGPEHPTSALPSTPCPCCGENSRWRLRSGGPWVCARCHPPQPPPEAIETVTVGEAVL